MTLPRAFYRTLPGSSWLVFCGVLTTAAHAQPASQTPVDTPEDCALIEDGIQRLACFDSLYQPEKRQAEATEAEKEEVQDKVDVLAPDGKALEDVAGNATEDDSDTGVMSELLDRYMAAEQAVFSFSGSFVGHRPTYILPVTWVKEPNRTPSSPRLGTIGYDYELEREEA
ncbi:MAG: phospholipase, partial [Marinobacter sp.]|nr:phospholipase [Marinobacter sp.]